MVSKWIGTYIFEQVCVYDGYKSCHDKNSSPLPPKWTLGTIFHAVGSIWTHWNFLEYKDPNEYSYPHHRSKLS